MLSDPDAPVLHLSQYGGPFLVAQITDIPSQSITPSASKQAVATPATAVIPSALPPPVPEVAAIGASTSSPALGTVSLNSTVAHEHEPIAATPSGDQCLTGPTTMSTPGHQPIGTLEAVVVWIHRYRLQRGVAMRVTTTTTLRHFVDLGIGLYLRCMTPRMRQPGDAPGTSTDGSGGYGIGGGYAPIKTVETRLAHPINTDTAQTGVVAASVPTRWQDIPGVFQVCAQIVGADVVLG